MYTPNLIERCFHSRQCSVWPYGHCHVNPDSKLHGPTWLLSGKLRRNQSRYIRRKTIHKGTTFCHKIDALCICYLCDCPQLPTWLVKEPCLFMMHISISYTDSAGSSMTYTDRMTNENSYRDAPHSHGFLLAINSHSITNRSKDVVHQRKFSTHHAMHVSWYANDRVLLLCMLWISSYMLSQRMCIIVTIWENRVSVYCSYHSETGFILENEGIYSKQIQNFMDNVITYIWPMVTLIYVFCILAICRDSL